MGNAYAWYDSNGPAGENGSDGEQPRKPRRPSQRRRLSADRKTFDFYHGFLGYPKVTVDQVAGSAPGGGLELALMADIAAAGCCKYGRRWRREGACRNG